MPTYELLISESISYCVQVEANSLEEAHTNYHAGLATAPYSEFTTNVFVVEGTEINENV